ncbi:MAG: pseudouridine-5'-phosphate glycosidase [Eubacterium sp.]|nr:pseudouridine-5'-phosphate glycosidase [Eubacterium sp.]
MKSDYLVVSDHVQDAIDKKMPVIAVETAEIYLGLKGGGAMMDGVGADGIRLNEGTNPDYYKVSEDIGNLIVQNGAVPAMIAVIDGKIHVGLSKSDMKYLSDHQSELKKICQSDLPMLLALGQDGVTTLSATMTIAQMVGINVVVTIGIGGVSEDYGDTHHVSADVEEMIHNRVVVVATGLTPGSEPERSLRFFDTHGISVIGFRSDYFYTRWLPEKEHKLRYRVDDPTDIAAALAVKRSLDIDGAILVFNPAATVISDKDSYDTDINFNHIREVINDNVTLAAWVAMAISMDLDPNINNRKSKRSSIPKKEKSMSFEVWLFAVKKFAQNYDVAQLIFNNLPDSEKERIRKEYEDTVE